MVRNAVAQHRIIEDLLDVSRIITGQLRLELDFVDVSSIASAAVDVVRPTAEAKDIKLHVVLNPDAGTVRGDAGRLQQVMWNLLVNAIKFTPRGGRVVVTVHRVDSSVQVEVIDNGQGIAPEFVPRVFERFTQQDAGSTRKTGGLGLGLAIVRHLIELHGGSVAAHSEGEGKGTMFVVRLPLLPVAKTARMAAGSDSSPPFEVAFPVELSGLQVLVVDDERDARELVMTVLEKGGASVQVASGSAEASR